MDKRKIAITTHKGSLSNVDSSDAKFTFFEMENDKIIGVEQSDAINKNNSANAAWWLSCKKVTELYVKSISKELKSNFKEMGIIVKQQEELVNDTFFNRFVFD